MGHAVDYTDIYFQLTREESWALEDGIVKDGAHSIEQGVGVRALAGEKTGFAYSDEVMLPALLEAAHAARAISRSGAGGSVQAWHATGGRSLYPADRSGRDDGRRRQGQVARADRPRGARARFAHHAGDGKPLGVARHRAGHGERRHARRRRAAAGTAQRQRHHRTGRPARAGLRRRRRSLRLYGIPRVRALACAGEGSRAHGAGQSRSGAGTGGHDDRRARRRLARRAAARSRRSRSRRRLQPQGHVRVQRTHRAAGRGQGRHDRRRRHARGTPRLAQRRRRRHAHAVHHADRGRHACAATCRTSSTRASWA